MIKFLADTDVNSINPIVYLDYQNKSNEDMLDILRELRYIMLNSKDYQKYLVVSNFTNCRTFKEFLTESDKYAKEIFNEKTLKACAFGFGTITKIAVSLYNSAHGSYLKVFDTLEQCLKYLTEK